METDPTPAYASISGFQHTLLEDSWVLHINADDSTARLELDLVLLPGHPEYTPPIPGEQYCYLGGTISFSHADAVVLDRSGAPPATSADGTRDLDNIDVWDVRHGRHHLSGSWGELDVWGGDVQLALDFRANYRVAFLPRLLGGGRAPNAFSGPHESGVHEGCVVEVFTGRGGSWLGDVPRGWGGGSDGVLRTPDPDRFVLVVGGRAWYVDVRHPERAEILDGWVYGGVSLLRQGLLLVHGEMSSCGIDRTGVRWRTQDFGPTYGPVTVIEADDDEATVELMDLHTDQPARVRISLADGHLVEPRDVH